MFSSAIKIVTAYIFILLLAAVAFGQQKPEQAPAKESKYVDFTGFKGKIFEVKYRDPNELRSILEPLGSGFKGAVIIPNGEFKTLTIRDFPENIAAIEEALKRLDVPTPARAARSLEANIELHMHVLLATNIEGASNPHPAEIDDVLKQLQSTLSYKNYYLLTSIVQRTKEHNQRSRGGEALSGQGTAEIGGVLGTNPNGTFATYSYHIASILPTPVDSGAPVVQLEDFGFKLTGHLGSADIRTGLNVHDGEKVVVGTASLGNKAMILVLSVKVIK